MVAERLVEISLHVEKDDGSAEVGYEYKMRMAAEEPSSKSGNFAESRDTGAFADGFGPVTTAALGIAASGIRGCMQDVLARL